MKASSKKDFDYGMLPLEIIAWPVGTWPLQKYDVYANLRSIVAVVLFLLMFAIVQAEIYFDHSDPEKNLDVLVLTACSILSMWKVTMFRVHSDLLIANFTSAVKDYEDLDGEEERAIVRRHARMGRVACASVIGFSYFAATLFLAVPMLAGDEEVALKDVNVTQEDELDFPIPSTYTMKNLGISEQFTSVVFLVEYAMLLMSCTGNVVNRLRNERPNFHREGRLTSRDVCRAGSDGLFCSITFHLCGQAELLKLEFKRFVEKSENISERFNGLTKRHRHLLKLSKMLNDAISSILAVQLFMSCILICMTGVQLILSLNVGNIVMALKSLLAGSSMVGQLFAYSYVGEYLKNQMEDIGYSAYCSTWYNIPSKLSRDIVFVLLRSQRLVQLKAGQFFVVNIATYMSIVRISISYLSVLRVMIMSMVAIVQIEVYMDHTDSEKNLDCLMLTFCGVIATSKVTLFRLRSDGLANNFSSAVKDYNELHGEEKRLIVKRHACMGRVACATILGISFSSVTMLLTVPVLFEENIDDEAVNVTHNDSMDYPFPSKYTITMLHMPKYLDPVIFLVEYMIMMVACTGNIGSDGLFFGITLHLCGQAEVLKLEFQNFIHTTENVMGRLDELICRHTHLLILAKKLNSTISSVLGVQVFMSCILICTTGFQFILSLSVRNIIMVMKTFTLMCTFLSQLFAYSFVGEYLKNQMESIGYSAYCSSWYDVSSKLPKNFVFVLLRTQRLVQLKAGEYFVINMESYMSILKTSMSYLSVLRLMDPSKVEASTNEDFAYAMYPLKILAWPVGTWPLQKYNFSSALRSIVTVVILIIMMIIVNVELYLNINDAEKNLDALVLIGCGILAVFKVTCFRTYCDGLVINFYSAMKDYNELDGEDKRAIVRHHGTMGRIACAGVLCFSCLSATFFTSVALFAGNDVTATKDSNATKRGLLDYPIPSELTMDALKMPKNVYPVIFISEYAMLLVTAAGNLGSDGLFFGITFHVCGQAEVLKLDFTRFVEETNKTADRLNALTNRHCHLLSLSEKLNDIISNILVVQLFTSCLLICTTGFQFILSLSVHNVMMVIKTFIVMSTVLSQLFAYSYVGEYLKNQMEGIGYSAYCSSWYDIPHKLSKDITFILLRAQIPVHLMARQFFVVNMQTYMSIVKTSMSYLSVLRVMITT
ncbi:uncharacterized protein LOC128893273 [Hylaeus anthracinus]|uniref:uncharacterized protein LOC128893273 n=1 Tax=Hylaeus anthracinus TaxID=313031 RepID=UPI0023B8CEB1|nr:uncharacterized protein LOC128893273 [Hylaeus anthracinus]